MALISRAPFKPQKTEWFQYVRRGDQIPFEFLRPGDVILTHGNHFFSRVIQFGQWLRYHGENKTFARWNHVAMVTSNDGRIVEELGAGTTIRNLSAYRNEEYVVVRVNASDHDRQQMVDYLEWVAKLGHSYGFGTIISITWSLLTGGRFMVGLDGSEVCSTRAAEALKAAGYWFNRRGVMPADLAHYFGVRLDGVWGLDEI